MHQIGFIYKILQLFENICWYAFMKYLSLKINFYVIQDFVTRHVVNRSFLFHYIEIEWKDVWEYM